LPPQQTAMQPHAQYRSEAFAEDLPGYGAEALAIPRAEAVLGASPAPRVAAVVWPLALAVSAATLLTVLAPLS
jgi:hypothetical protein